MLKRLPSHLRFLASTWIFGLIFFTLCRLVLYMLNKSDAGAIPGHITARAFLTGLQFDNVISGYFIALPAVFAFAFFLAAVNRPFTKRFLFLLLLVFYLPGFIILCSDMPWFEHQQTRFTIAAFQWTNTPGMMMKFVFGDARNYPYLLLLVFLITVFYYTTKKLLIASSHNEEKRNLKNTLWYVFFLLLVFISIRGRFELKSPIRWGTAFTSEYNFTNQLGLNPVYSFMQSYLDSKNPRYRHRQFMDEKKAEEVVRNYFHPGTGGLLRREITAQPGTAPHNIVLVLMEGMSSYNMHASGNKENLTPQLDSLHNVSLSFTDFFSDGIHTFNGIYSSFFGVPSLPLHHHMKDLNNQQPYSGLARVLSENGYHTVYLTSHDEQFDNAGGFLSSNGFREIISQKDFDRADVLNALGVPDHILFKKAVNVMDENAKTGKPFFAGILTASNHGPYELPPGIDFKPHSNDTRKQLIEYADWAVGQFLSECRKYAWFNNTIFLFTGDHGAVVEGLDVTLTYHRVPFIIHAPGIIPARTTEKLGGQVDIFPTVMGILGLGYENNSFGINLMDSERIFVTFSYDESYGCFGKNDYYTNRNGIESHVFFKPGTAASAARTDSMRDFTNAVFQVKQTMLEKKMMN